MNGQIPVERARLSGRRVDDRLRLRAAAAALPVDPLAVAAAWEAAAWDAPRCQDHAEISPLWPVIERALVAATRLTDLQATVDSGDVGAIAAAWDEAELGAYALPPPLLDLVRSAIAEIGCCGAELEPLLIRDAEAGTLADPAAIGATSKHLILRWIWPANGPSACAIAVRGDRFPTAPDDVAHRRHARIVERAGFAAEDGVRLGAVGDEVFAMVWPVRLVAGAPVVARNARPLRLARSPKLVLAHAAKRQWLRRGGMRLKLTSVTDLDVPALLVQAVTNPVGDTRVLCRVPAGRISAGEPAVIELPQLEDKGDARVTIRVAPEDPRELAWLELRHPALKV